MPQSGTPLSLTMQIPYELALGWRYTRAGRATRRNGFISFISGVSMLGIALGVAALIIVLSVMNGFQKEVRDRMLSVVSHIEIFAPGGAALPDVAQTLAEARRNPAVVGAAPFVAAQALLARGEDMKGALVRGIDPAREGEVTDLAAANADVLRQHSGVGGGQVGHFGLVVGIDTAHQRALHVLAARQQGLRGHEGRGAHHLRLLAGLGQGARHVGQRRAAGGKNLDVRDHAEHAVAHFFLKTVHHREHDDQRRHTQGNAQHGDARDKRDKAVAPRGAPSARVAPAQGEFVGDLHGSAIVAPGWGWSRSGRAAVLGLPAFAGQRDVARHGAGASAIGADGARRHAQRLCGLRQA